MESISGFLIAEKAMCITIYNILDHNIVIHFACPQLAGN